MRSSPRSALVAHPSPVGRDARSCARRVVGSPDRWRVHSGSACSARACWRIASCSLIATERPARDVVQAARSGHVLQCGAKRAMPLPSPRRVIVATCPAGQVTVRASRSTTKRSLVNPPVALRIGGHFAMRVKPPRPRLFRVAPSA